MTRWLAGILTILFLGAAAFSGANASEKKKPPADAPPQNKDASGEAQEKAAPKNDNKNDGTAKGAPGKSPAPDAANETKPNNKAVGVADPKAGTASPQKKAGKKTPPKNTAKTAPTSKPAPVAPRDEALLRDLEMLLLLEILNDYDMFESVEK